MSAAVSIPWPGIPSDVTASSNAKNSSSSDDGLRLYRPQADVHSEFRCFDPADESLEYSLYLSKSDQNQPPSPSVTQEKRLPNVADWKGTLDFVTGMTGVAGEQRKDLKEQIGAQQSALEDLQSDLNEAQQRLRAAEQRAHELQAQADMRLQRVQAVLDAQVQEVRADTEARVRTIRARNSGVTRAAEERVHAAELRAQTAEEWLQRIDTAARNLLLNGSMIR